MHFLLLLIFKFLIFNNIQKPEIAQLEANQKSLEIIVTGIENQKGMILLNLFNSEEGFPGEREKAYKSLEQKIVNNKVTLFINDLPEGKYAASVIHDENNNRKLDTNFKGVPKEGYGASNNVKKMFRAPRFDEASFEIGEDLTKIEIE
ncbi:DUF2141 domain-containing protein [soil metagenome]